MESKEERREALFEDLVQYANNWTAGTHSGSEIQPKKITVLDILKQDTDDSDHKAPVVLPHQLSTFIDQLGDVYVKIQEMQQQVVKAFNTSLAQDTKNIKNDLQKIFKALEKQKELSKTCAKILDKIDSR